jgi:O-methyltransferase
MRMKQQFGESLKIFFAERGVVMARYTEGDRRTRLSDIAAMRKQGRLLQNPAEGCQLISALRATLQVAGDIAEVGTASGGSARLIGDYSGGKTIHVFDTFAGLPQPGPMDVRFKRGTYASSLDDVRKYLQGLPVEFHQGLFPESAIAVEKCRFSFVHLDVDLYQSTLDGLEFFYSRMNPGGIIISHDYVSAEGVNQAFEEFFADKPETPIELIGYQGMIVKLSANGAHA